MVCHVNTGNDDQGISIVTKCEPCIEWHVQQTDIAGTSDEEIHETINVVIGNGRGSADF
ncbi:hypothetical protein [Methanobacterium petrolearium]|uniref:hypothetical protein n=1 Tax=Methanobacterium petrolearium TaxID=710190 RepID=UPI001AEA067C|nr:hypothetical protein [Methanobacterium petrolearium]